MAKSTTPKKVRRRRKPMSEEQRKAAVERLAKAREKRALANPPKYKNVHPDVLAIPDDDPMSRASVMGWIKENKEKLNAAKQERRANVKGSDAKVAMISGYISSMETYLKSGTWTSLFSGADMNKRVFSKCVAPAYDKDGNVKRSYGVYYDDLGYVWGYEDDLD